MKFYISAAILLLVPALVVGQNSRCRIDDTVQSFVSQYSRPMNLQCRSVTDRSSYASCPSGYTATSCSCGNSCGSWDIQSPNKCHCQCNNMDWTTVVCCRITS